MSEFGRWAALVDHLELIGGCMVGGPTAYVTAETEWAEGNLLECVPETLGDFRFLALRLGRAVENGWHASEVASLIAVARV